MDLWPFFGTGKHHIRAKTVELPKADYGSLLDDAGYGFSIAVAEWLL